LRTSGNPFLKEKGVTDMKRTFLLTALALAGASLLLAASSTAAVPQSTAKPSIGGAAKQGSTLTASDGGWANSPTSFAYHWQRCADDGTGCTIIAATDKTYTLAAADVGHTVRVIVTATNADGNASATSDPTDVVGSANGPRNDVKPSLNDSSPPTVGDAVTVSNGLWTPTPRSFERQWQRCDSTGADCRDIDGAIGKTYYLRRADVGQRVRALVTAHVSGEQTTVPSELSAVVTSSTSPPTTTTLTTTTVVTTTTPAPRAPRVRLLALVRVGGHVHVRFRVCAQEPGFVRITERDLKAKALPYVRRFTVYVVSCSTKTKTWVLLPRFRRPGRFLVTLRARDDRGMLSELAARSIVLR
jgi:hypothetical protein